MKTRVFEGSLPGRKFHPIRPKKPPDRTSIFRLCLGESKIGHRRLNCKKVVKPMQREQILYVNYSKRSGVPR